MVEKPKLSHSATEKELDKVQAQFEAFDQDIKSMTHDRMNATPKPETEGPKLSQCDISKAGDVYIKPHKTIACREIFNEKYRSDWEFAKEWVQITAHNNEIIGEQLEFWTKPFAGIPAQYWNVPCNKPVWVHRYVAERIKGCTYHRLIMQENVATQATGNGVFYGKMAVDTTVQRLDAHPVSQRKSIFMGPGGF